MISLTSNKLLVCLREIKEQYQLQEVLSVMHVQVSPCSGEGLGWLQVEGSIKTPLLGWDTEAGVNPQVTEVPFSALPAWMDTDLI